MNAPTVSNLPAVASREEWLAARKDLLAAEKAHTRAQDALNRRRRELPMVPVGREYRFTGVDGTERTLPGLFDGRRQLIVYHFMFGPDAEQGCPSCSLLADGVGDLSHLHARDTTLVFVSRAPAERLRAYRERMGWDVPWFSTHGPAFNHDHGATIDPAAGADQLNFATVPAGTEPFEMTGTSVFLRPDPAGAEVFHTYSCYARGGDARLAVYNWLDLTPLGRQEDWERPAGRSDGPFMSWVRRHDEY